MQRVLALGWLALVPAGCRQALGFDEPDRFELGAICTGPGSADVGQCLAAAPVCLSLSGTTYFCTASCGNSVAGPGSGSPLPPPDGDALCQSLISAGTPVCGYYGDATNGVVPWFCAILCGTGSDGLGSCPPGLTCVSNSCR
jgi:hypothetical protein